MATTKGSRRRKGRFSSRIPEELIDRLHAYCDRHNYIMSSVIEDAIRYHLGKIEEAEGTGKKRNKPAAVDTEAESVFD